MNRQRQLRMIRRIGDSVRKRRVVRLMDIVDPIAKRTLIDIAIAYEQLAILAEAKLASKE